MISSAAVEARRAVCRDSCTEKCSAFLAGTLNHADPHEKCPRQGWILAWGCYGSGCRDRSATKPTGLGDVVAAVAQPIARAIDAALGTKISGCGGCKKRRETLNAKVPDITHPFRGP